MKKRLFLSLASLLVLVLGVASCASPATTPPLTSVTAPTTTAAQPTTTTKAPVAQGPVYGGTLRKFIGGDFNWLDTNQQASGSDVMGVVTQPLWAGDWTKGPAGGYGTKQTDWGASNGDSYDLKTGYLAESVKWTVDAENNRGTIVAQIRQGIRWQQTGSDASKLVAGRQMTADDVVSTMQRNLSSGSYLSGANPELLVAEITKSGQWEVTVKVPLNAMVAAMTRLFTQTYIQPPEVVQKYSNMRDWHNFVGTGAFMLTDYVTGSMVVLTRNPGYWMKDPIGPGKGQPTALSRLRQAADHPGRFHAESGACNWQDRIHERDFDRSDWLGRCGGDRQSESETDTEERPVIPGPRHPDVHENG